MTTTYYAEMKDGKINSVLSFNFIPRPEHVENLVPITYEVWKEFCDGLHPQEPDNKIQGWSTMTLDQKINAIADKFKLR